MRKVVKFPDQIRVFLARVNVWHTMTRVSAQMGVGRPVQRTSKHFAMRQPGVRG